MQKQLWINRRDFLLGATAFGVAGCRSARLFTHAPEDYDKRLVVFLSDLHVRDRSCYQYRYFADQVAEILRMDPLPAKVVVFGDIAYCCGLKGEYETSAPFFRQMIDAGIEVVFGMGNHDRRSAFLETWPEYAARQILEGRIVSNTDLGPADLLMLDGLQGSDTRAENDMGPVPGRFDERQQEWIADRIARLERPTFVCSHYPLTELAVCGKPFAECLAKSPKVAGYIYGHCHRWDPDWEIRSWGGPEIFRTLCLPSTGHWGDIGYVRFRLGEGAARAEFVQKGFFFHSPDASEPVYGDILAEHRDTTCTFRWR